MEAIMLRNDDYKQRIAAGITEGILQFFKARKEQQEKESSEPTRLALGNPIAVE